jgi:hypothetical protein
MKDEIIYDEFESLDEAKNISLLNNKHMGNLGKFKRKRGKNAKHNYDFLNKKYNKKKRVAKKVPKKINMSVVKESGVFLKESFPERKYDLDCNMLADDMILSETYYGKNDGLVECEAYIDDLKKYLISGKNPNNAPAKVKLENKLAQIFGFEKVYFLLIANETSSNAFTVLYYYDKDKDMHDKFFDIEKSNKNGVKFKNPKNKFLYIYSYNYLIRNVPTKNIMATLLHEIGHNFFLIRDQIHYSRSRCCTEICINVLEYLKDNNFDRTATAIATQVLLENFVAMKDTSAYFRKEYKDKLTNEAHAKVIKKAELLEHPIIKNINRLIDVASAIFSTLFRIPITPIYLVLAPFIVNGTIMSDNDKNSFKKMNKFSDDYSAEKFADNFAASYGYGVELAEFFNDYRTIENNEKIKIRQSIPVCRVMDLYSELLCTYTTYFANPHPDNYYRIKFTLDKLKFELKNNKDQLNPKQVAEIESDVNRLESMLSDAPKYYKAINEMFEIARSSKDRMGIKTNNITNNKIFDFDKELIKDNIVKENYDEMLDLYFEDFNDFVDIINHSNN